MANEQGATPEQRLHATRAALDRLGAKLVAEFGAEVTAHLLTELARKYADVFIAEVRGEAGWAERPMGSA